MTTASLAGPREAGARCPSCNVEIPLQSPIVVCPACGAVHHRPCWDRRPGCGSYQCGPSRREVDDDPSRRLVITAEDLRRAPPPPPRRLAASAAAAAAAAPARMPRGEPPRVSRLSIAALITAVLGIPLFGLVTGLVAILMASVALSRITATRRRGVGLAVGALLIGVADVVGWAALLSHSRMGPAPAFAPEGAEPDLSAADVAPKIFRAMRANVLIERRAGWNGLASGSGVILDLAGGVATIVTNRHVVDPGFPARSAPPDLDQLNDGGLSVKPLKGPARPGRITWVAPDGIDLALVRIAIAPDETETARWVPGRPLRVGDPVFAIGNPRRLSWTHTQGVVSQFRTADFGGRAVRIIQTQTAINPGNSGGGLYDDESYLVGINTWTSDKSSSEGLNFAIAFDSLLALEPPGLAAPAAAAARPKGKAP